MPGSRLRDDQRGKQGHRQEDRIDPLTWSLEPEVGFEPTTFRLRVVEHSSSPCGQVPSSQLTSVAPSAEYASDPGRYGRWHDQGNDQPPEAETPGPPRPFDCGRKVEVSARSSAGTSKGAGDEPLPGRGTR